MSDECFICSTYKRTCTGKKGRTLGEKGTKSLGKAANERSDILIQTSLSTASSVWVSDTCYKHYTDSRNFNKTVTVDDDGDGDQQNQSFERRRRSAPFNYRTHCLICEGELDFVTASKRPDVPKYQISEVNIVNASNKECKIHNTLKEVCRGRSDPLSVEVAAKLSYAPCLRAYEAKYHRTCMQRFLSSVSVCTGETNYKHFDASKNEGFDKFCDWYESTGHESTSSFTLFEVQQRIENINNNDEVYSIRQISRKLSERYGAEGSEVRLTSCEGLPKIMLLQEEADSIVTDTVLDSSVGAAAKIIKECLQEDHQTDQTDQTDQFYPYPNELTLDKLTAEVPIPLKTFLDMIFSKSRTETAAQKKELRKIAVAHSIMQYCKKEGYISPLLLCIGLFVHKVTRSRVIIDVLHSVGFSVSYSEVLMFEKCAAISSIHFDDIVSDSEIESENIFWQFIADNFDHNEDTITGGNTTHVMGIISCETPKPQFSTFQPIQRQNISSGKILDAAKFGDILKVYSKPSKSQFKQILLKKLSHSTLQTTIYQKLDTYWTFSSLFMKNAPNWQGFMANIIHGTNLPTQIKYHQNVPLDPSSHEAVYSTMTFVKQQIKQKKICCTSLTFDQPLFWKASEIKADKSPELDCIHLKLGGFHQLMSFMGAGCKFMQDGGLKELWSTVYKENSLPKMMEGKAYSRCLRACLLTDTALHFTLLSGNDHSEESEESHFFEPVRTFNEQEDFADFADGNIFDALNDDEDHYFDNIDFGNGTEKSIASFLLEKLKSNCDDNDDLLLFNDETIEHLSKLYESLEKQEVSLDEVSEHPTVNSIHNIISNLKFVQDVSRTGKLWVQFMDFVAIIRMFIRAERTGNFDLHIHSSEQMLPFLAAAGHDKYTIAVRKYLQDVKDLCPCLEKKYKEGCFTICRNDKLFWSGTFTDQVIEQTLMRSGKTQGGLINITHNDAARTKWLLSSHIVASYTEALRDLTGVTTGTWSEQHRDMQGSRRKENNRHLRNFIDFLDIHNPFKAPANQLVNIATGVIASEEVNVDSAVEIGTKIISGMDDKKLGEISLKRKDQAKTFAIMRKCITVGEKSVQMSSDHLSQRLLASVMRDEASLSEILSHELSAVAPALFLDNGQMRKNNKAELMNELLPRQTRTDISKVSAYHVIDGCAWLYHIYWPKVGTISDLYHSFLQTLSAECGSNIEKVSVLFDGYEVESTKGPEQKRRKKNLVSVKMNVDWSLPIPHNMKNFLASSSNKQQLIDLFSQKLLIDGIVVKQATGDADTLIVKETLNKSEEFDTVIVHSMDTDIFVALLHHINSAVHNEVIMVTKKGHASINEISKKLSAGMKECLPFAHAISGCDTVSATYGLGKLRAFKKLNESTWKDVMNIVGDEDVDVEYVIELGEKFFMGLYGNLATKAKSLDHLREIMYTLPKYIPISRMPPTSRAFRFHMLRTHLEVNTCKHLEQMLEEEEYGFERNADGQLVPIITDKPPAPSYLLQEIKCSCQKPNRAGLLCTGCGCSKAGLPCNLLCKCECQCENN